jgi:hypothetical protein
MVEGQTLLMDIAMYIVYCQPDQRGTEDSGSYESNGEAHIGHLGKSNNGDELSWDRKASCKRDLQRYRAAFGRLTTTAVACLSGTNDTANISILCDSSTNAKHGLYC